MISFLTTGNIVFDLYRNIWNIVSRYAIMLFVPLINRGQYDINHGVIKYIILLLCIGIIIWFVQSTVNTLACNKIDCVLNKILIGVALLSIINILVVIFQGWNWIHFLCFIFSIVYFIVNKWHYSKESTFYGYFRSVVNSYTEYHENKYNTNKKINIKKFVRRRTMWTAFHIVFITLGFRYLSFPVIIFDINYRYKFPPNDINAPANIYKQAVNYFPFYVWKGERTHNSPYYVFTRISKSIVIKPLKYDHKRFQKYPWYAIPIGVKEFNTKKDLHNTIQTMMLQDYHKYHDQSSTFLQNDLRFTDIPGPTTHFFVAGATGGGKTVQLLNMIEHFSCATVDGKPFQERNPYLPVTQELSDNNSNDITNIINQPMSSQKFGTLAVRQFIIDLKGVDFGPTAHYRNVIQVARILDDAYDVVEMFKKELLRRKGELMQAGQKEVPCTPEGLSKYPPLILIVDEAAQFFANDNQEYRMKQNKISNNFDIIAALGRAFGIHYILCSQTAGIDLYSHKMFENTRGRLIMGNVSESLSNRMINSCLGTTIPQTPGSALYFDTGSPQPQSYRAFFNSIKQINVHVPMKSDAEWQHINKIEEKKQQEFLDNLTKETEDEDDDEYGMGLFKKFTPLNKKKTIKNTIANKKSFVLHLNHNEISTQSDKNLITHINQNNEQKGTVVNKKPLVLHLNHNEIPTQTVTKPPSHHILKIISNKDTNLYDKNDGSDK